MCVGQAGRPDGRVCVLDRLADLMAVCVCVCVGQAGRPDGRSSGGAGHTGGDRLRGGLHSRPEDSRRHVHSHLPLLRRVV